MKTFVHHAHIFPKELKYVSPTSGMDGTIDTLERLMNELNIEEAVVFAPYPRIGDRLGFDTNLWLAKQLSSHPRLLGFGMVDFRKGCGRLAPQVEEIKKMGLIGLKLHPAEQQFGILSREALEVYGAAESAGLPISFHTGVHWHALSADHPLMYDEVARKFPRLIFSMEHVGGYHFFRDAVAVIMNNFRGNDDRLGSNIYASIVSSLTDTPRVNFWYLGEERIAELAKLVGPEYILFGLDYPHRTLEEVKYALQTINKLFPDEHIRQNILSDNLRRFLGMS